MVASVRLYEYIGDPPGVPVLTEYIHLIGRDAESGGEKGYVQNPIRPRQDGAPAPSYERWFRFEFKQPFTQVFDFFFWMPDLVIPEGWSVRYGVVPSFQTPSASDSAIANQEVPTTKPERPNAGGVVPLEGDQVRYSDFIVVQATVRDDAPVGPMLGFDPVTKVARPLQYRFVWTEL